MADGVKHDGNKPRMDLVPWGAVREVAKVLTYGASKYPEPDNWKRVPDARSRYFAAALRHLVEWWETNGAPDEETGLSHLAHAGCCVLFLLWGELNATERVPAILVTKLREDLDRVFNPSGVRF